jgi:hypothetical protein
VSAADTIGPQILGRIPSKPDNRNYNLAAFLPASLGDDLDHALSDVLGSWASSKTKTFAKVLVHHVRVLEGLAPQPAPGPTPPPSPTAANWVDSDDPILDQGQTPHCVGFTGADWMNANPVDDHVQNAIGDEIYYDCKVKDGEPNQENGSSIHTLAKVLKARGRLSTYAFASSIDDVWKFILSPTGGPICWGIGWTNSMFSVDGNGFVVPSGSDVDGHAIIQYGVDGDVALMRNHWGTGWGLGGDFKMHKADLAERLSNGGEALAAVELP